MRAGAGRGHAAPGAGRGRGAAFKRIGVRYVHGEISLEEAADLGCRACASPGGGCQFLGTAATSQVVGEALGMSLGHSALAPSGHAIWLDMATRSAAALMRLESRGVRMRDILTDAALHNAMVTHAAFGGSTNLILHLPAIAHAAGLRRPTAADWTAINRRVPRLVDALPNGPRHHPTVQVFQAGAVPEVMLHLRRAGLLETGALTVSGLTLGEQLDEWESSERRTRLRDGLRARDGVDPDDVIMSPEDAARRGLTSTFCAPIGNLAPEGSVIKATAIDPSVIGADGVYRFTGPARVFVTEPAAIAAIKAGRIQAGDVLVLICRGPLGAGMEETYQLTSALKYLPFGKHVALLTDARFSGVSTGACIGHVSPEALSGGPIGKLRDGDLVEIEVDRVKLEGTVDFVGEGGVRVGAEAGARDPGAATPAAGSRARSRAARRHAVVGRAAGCQRRRVGRQRLRRRRDPARARGRPEGAALVKGHLTRATALPADAARATLIGRAWLPDVERAIGRRRPRGLRLRPVGRRRHRERPPQPRRSVVGRP